MSEHRSSSFAPSSVEDPDVARILVVDDDPDIREALESYFQVEGYNVASASDGEEALRYLDANEGFDLVLLDVMLPKLDGFDVLQRSQQMGTSSPVLMMSGRGDQEDILRGFGLGAQDYIVKPFDAEELVARTKTLLGRRGDTGDPPSSYHIGDLEIDFVECRCVRNGSPVQFTEMELDLLQCLIQNRGYVMTKKRLLRDAWRIDEDLIAYTINPDIATGEVDQTIETLRGKVEEDPTKPTYIETVYGLGYRFSD